jgi:hypothetical protein
MAPDPALTNPDRWSGPPDRWGGPYRPLWRPFCPLGRPPSYSLLSLSSLSPSCSPANLRRPPYGEHVNER